MALLYARSGFARSAATRSGYLLYVYTPGPKSRLEARSGVARSGATRSNYCTQWAFLFIGGAERTNRLIKGSLDVTFFLNQQKNTARMKVWGFDPQPGQLVQICSAAPTAPIFTGTVIRTTQNSVPRNQINIYDVECVDYLWLLNRRRVTRRYAAGTPSNFVVLDLMQSFSTGFTTVNVQAGGPPIGQTSFRGDLLSNAIQQICDQSGWHFYVDALADAHFYLSEALAQPTTLTPVTYNYEELQYQLDLTQVRTQVTAIGGGGQATAQAAVGASSIAVNETGWYTGSGGLALSGENLITYTGRSTSSGAGNLTGVSGVANVILVGDTVSVRSSKSDIAAQTALIALEGGDGIHEDWIENGHWSQSETDARAQATLDAFKMTDIRGSYTSYDISTRIGRHINIQLPRRNINVTVTIQKVRQYYRARTKWQYEVDFSVVWSDLVDIITGVVQPSIGG